MPNIPGIRYNQSLAGPINQPQATPDAFGASAWRAAGNLGQEVADLGEQLKNNYDTSKASNYSAKAKKRIDDFTNVLQNGSADQDGNLIPAPDVSQHEELFSQELERINADAEQELGSGRAMSLFASDFSPYASKTEFEVKKNRLAKLKNESLAFLDEELDLYAKQFVDQDELKKPGIQRAALASIQRAVANGLISDTEAVIRIKKFNERVQTASFLKILNTDPIAAKRALQNGEFDSFPPDTVERLMKTATDTYESNLRKEEMEANRLTREEEKAQREVEEQTAKDGWRMQAEGKLTPKWVMDNEDNLGEAKFKLLLDAASGRVEQQPDMGTYISLKYRASQGEDVRKEIIEAGNKKLLNISAINTLFSDVEQNSAGPAKDNKYRRGMRNLQTRLQSQIAKDDVNANHKAAQAMDAYQVWAAENPNALDEEHVRKVEALTEDAINGNTLERKSSKRLPRYYEGTRATLTREGVFKSLQKAKQLFKEGKISKAQLDIEAIEAAEWMPLFPPPAPKETAGKK